MASRRFNFHMVGGSAVLVAALIVPALAAPGLQVTKPPVTPFDLPTGPGMDPCSASGQWFQDLEGNEQFRSHEFYDNVYNPDNPTGAGGGWASTRAIRGHVVDVTFDTTGTYIERFKIKALITNDMPAIGETFLWSGDNRHNEALSIRQQFDGTMYKTKMAIEFAIADRSNLPAGFVGPYVEGPRPFVIAENEDQLGWYCFNPESEQGAKLPGAYWVPVWDFGPIEPGAEVSRILEFSVEPPGLDASDMRFGTILNSLQQGDESDLLANRTPSLKISTWIENMGWDDGAEIPEMLARGSNASVFFNIAGTYFTLDVNVINPQYGQVEIMPPWAAYPPGWVVQLTALPEPNRGFSEWTLYDPNYGSDPNYATTDTANPIWITMMDDRQVDATFTCGTSAAPMLPMMMVGMAGWVWFARRRR